MSNENVIIAFLQGEKAQTNTRYIVEKGQYRKCKGQTLKTDGNMLINYSTVIAHKQDNKLFINKGKYSPTTSKIQGQLNYIAKQYYNDKNIIYYEDNNK